MTTPMVFVEVGGGPGSVVRLVGAAYHYLARVVRVKPGERIRLSDAQGASAVGEVMVVDGESIAVRVLEAVPPGTRLFDLTLVVSLLKQSRSDDVVAAAAELGVARLIFTSMERSVVRLVPERAERKDRGGKGELRARPNGAARATAADERSGSGRSGSGRLERLARVALEAARQVGQPLLPVLETASGLDEALDRVSGAPIYFLWENGGEPLTTLDLVGVRSASCFVGPEGGWGDAEVELLLLRGAIPLRLHGPAYRAGTATLAASVLFLHRAGAL